jgi:AcrR family transcriptional regulator
MIHKVNPDSTTDSRSMRAASKALVRAAILDAAEACFAEQGIDRAPMGEVARRAGVAVGTIYNYFGGRDALVRAVLDRRNGELDARLTRALVEPAPLPRAIEVLVHEVFDHCAEHAAFYSLLLQGETAVRRPPGHGPGMRIVLEHAKRVFAAATDDAASEVGLETDLTVGCIRGGILHALARGGDRDLWCAVAKDVTRFVLEGRRQGG